MSYIDLLFYSHLDHLDLFWLLHLYAFVYLVAASCLLLHGREVQDLEEMSWEPAELLLSAQLYTISRRCSSLQVRTLGRRHKTSHSTRFRSTKMEDGWAKLNYTKLRDATSISQIPLKGSKRVDGKPQVWAWVSPDHVSEFETSRQMCCGSSQPLIKAVFNQLGVMGSQRMPMVEEWFATNQEQHTDMKPIAWEREFDAFSLAVSFGRLRQDRAELIAEIFALLNPSGSGLPAARGWMSRFFIFVFFRSCRPQVLAWWSCQKAASGKKSFAAMQRRTLFWPIRDGAVWVVSGTCVNEAEVQP